MIGIDNMVENMPCCCDVEIGHSPSEGHTIQLDDRSSEKPHGGASSKRSNREKRFIAKKNLALIRLMVIFDSPIACTLCMCDVIFLCSGWFCMVQACVAVHGGSRGL